MKREPKVSTLNINSSNADFGTRTAICKIVVHTNNGLFGIYWKDLSRTNLWLRPDDNTHLFSFKNPYVYILAPVLF